MGCAQPVCAASLIIRPCLFCATTQVAHFQTAEIRCRIPTAMPTPINHLVMGQELFQSRLLSPSVQELLEAHFGPFLLGHTAADVQTVSGQPRHETHFYDIPPSNRSPAYRTLLDAHPDLNNARLLDSDHAAFVAGYLAHLLADEAWWSEVFYPFFSPAATWGSWDERKFLHNVLRTHLDREDQGRLGEEVRNSLARAEPRNWLPFVDDQALRMWRDWLVEQLRPDSRVMTAEVFARRMNLPVGEVEAALESTHRMDYIFQHIPRSSLEAYRDNVRQRSASLVDDYLRGRFT